MKSKQSEQADMVLVKRATGIRSLDIATRGGLPAHGATLIIGEPGCGKTILGLQIFAGALARGEGGVFMSFEESSTQILRNTASFSWGERLHDTSRCQVIDAHGMKGTEFSGAFDIEGLLAMLESCAGSVDGTWIMLDGIDQLLRHQPDQNRAIEQVAQMNDWCEQKGYTLLLTGKHSGDRLTRPEHLAGIEFMLPTIFVLSSQLVDGRLHRRFRIAKYRGTQHDPDELAVLIDNDGIHLPYADSLGEEVPANSERLGTGIGRLDDVLGGGLYRGSTTLISGQPGTSKTTIAAAFAREACQRGERALFVSFDELASRIVRNVASVGIDLQTHIDSDNLALHTHTSWHSLAEHHFMALQQRIDEFKPDCLVIDPASAMLKASSAQSPQIALERLLERTRREGITTLLTSLSSNDDMNDESTLASVSTLADTWIVLRYQIRGGERNRSLSVVKSRGTAHSNQVRELVLSSGGIDLADVYQYGTEVLMGTARAEKESEVEAARQRENRERDQHHRILRRQIDKTQLEISQQQTELERLRAELEDESAFHGSSDQESARHNENIRQRREPEHKISREKQGTQHRREGDQ
jgi:circadian clock protein KaiC